MALTTCVLALAAAAGPVMERKRSGGSGRDVAVASRLAEEALDEMSRSPGRIDDLPLRDYRELHDTRDLSQQVFHREIEAARQYPSGETAVVVRVSWRAHGAQNSVTMKRLIRGEASEQLADLEQ